eukprot:TRINITY_DN15499_c0_g1_i2.p1 TRINITY_DN15499_c0_g1~~TRINITY_DN15499_c0_g1_i2.p1  ORF type:complete len:216 (+),score=32.41 TRINITY_DN15499_c0_g1_i2:41-649(+)
MSKGGGKGGYRPDFTQQRGFRKDEVEAECAKIIKEERSKGYVYLDVSTVLHLLMNAFKVNEVTQLGCRYPNQIEPIRELSNLQASVMMLINLYRSEFKMGSLHECLEYVVRQAADMKLTSGPVLRFEDLGVGPYHRHPELISHFPGIKDLAEPTTTPFPRPPVVTAFEMFEAFVNVMKSRRKGSSRITPQQITDKIEMICPG